MEVSHPFDAYLFISISALIFFYTMLGNYFNANTSDLFVYLIYSVGMLFSLILGIFLIQMQDQESEGGMPFGE
jgi:hypothetical protein